MGDLAADYFSSAVHDELWDRGRLLERRISQGRARVVEGVIVAEDAKDPSLGAIAEREVGRMRQTVAPLLDGSGPRVRLIAEARSDGLTCTITIRRGNHSIVTSPPFLGQDDELLRSVVTIVPEGESIDYHEIPMLWRNGTAAVLLHEAAGHPAEHGHPPLAWPPWLHVCDGDVDLLAGLPPWQMRRASFRDVPLRRMTDLIVRQSGAPYELPVERLELLLIDGGTYEPLSGIVTVSVAAADLVTREGTRRVPPFRISESRQAIARALTGAAGEPIRYPGVVCSREGQEVVVGSAAPLMLAVFE